MDLGRLWHEPILTPGQAHLTSGSEELVLAVSTRLSECVKQVTSVDERIIHVRLTHICGFMTVVAVYASLNGHELRDKE